MSLRVRCKCGRQLRLRKELAGKRVVCPDCDAGIDIPAKRAREAGRRRKSNGDRELPRTSTRPGQSGSRRNERGPLLGRECPFCHERISIARFDAHVREHTELRDDGQMHDHVTLPPRHRATRRRVSREPSVYEHRKCGAATQMPEEIIQTYLVDPCFYNSYTFCTGCNTYRHEREFRWVDTGESLTSYKRRLFAEKGVAYKIVWGLTTTMGMAVAGFIVGALIAALFDPIAATAFAFAGAAVGAGTGFLTGRYMRIAAVRAFDL